MTPSWLGASASYIDSSRTITADQLTFNAGSVSHAALLKVPMIPAGVVCDSSPLTVDITAISDMACQTVPVLLGFKHVTREIMEVILHVMDWKACLAIL